MKPGSFLFIFITLLISASACNPLLTTSNRVIVVQPLTDLPASQAKKVYEKLKEINPNTILRNAIALPASAFYPKKTVTAPTLLLAILTGQEAQIQLFRQRHQHDQRKYRRLGCNGPRLSTGQCMCHIHIQAFESRITKPVL